MKTRKHIIFLTLAMVMVVNSIHVIAQTTAENTYLYMIRVNDKEGFIDNSEKIVIEPQFDEVNDFSEGLAAVVINGKSGFIDKTGKIVIEPQFDYVGYFKEGRAYVEIGNYFDHTHGYIDKTGKFVPENTNTSEESEFYYSSFSDGLAAILKDGMWGFVDETGNMVIEPQFPDTCFEEDPHFSEGFAAVQIDGKWGFIDKTGSIAIEPKFDYVFEFSEGLASVRIGDSDNCKYGYIDKTGKYVITPQFGYAGNFTEGLASVYVGKDVYEREPKFGFIDKTGKFVINPQFNLTMDFYGGIAAVWKDGLYHYIDKKGNIIWSGEEPYNLF